MKQKTRPPATSRKAFGSQKGNITSLKEKVMRTMKRIKWGARDKVAAACGLKPDQVWRRLSDLKKDGLIVKTDKAVRSKETGELQAIYKLPGYKLKLSA